MESGKLRTFGLKLVLLLTLPLAMAACGGGGGGGGGGGAPPATPPPGENGDPPTVVTVTLSPTNPTIAVGATQQFTASGFFSDSTTSDITGDVTWESDSTSVATIDSTGFAMGIATGSATISATATSGVTGQTTLTVSDAFTITGTAPAAGAVVNDLSQIQLTLSRAGNFSELTDTANYALSGTGVGTMAVDTVGTTTTTVTLYTTGSPVDGTVQLSVAGLTATDGIPLTGATEFSYTIDVTAPTLTQSVPADGGTLGSLPQVDIAFSEAVLGADDIGNYTLSGNVGTLALDSVQTVAGGSPNTYRLTLTGEPVDGIINLSLATAITDLAGNSLPLADRTVSYTMDVTSPVQTAVPVAGSTLNGLTSVAITYSLAVTGADTIGNYAFSGAGAGTLSVSSIDVSGDTYTLNLTGAPAEGDLTITISNVQSASDGISLAGNTIAYSFDLTGPTVTVSPTAGSALGSTPSIEFTFDEAVTGADDPASYAFGGAGGAGLQVESVAPAGNTYTLDLFGIPRGGAIDLTLTGITDLAGNAPATAAFAFNATTPLTLQSSGPVAAIAFGNGRFVGVGASNIQVSGTNDLTAWTRLDLATSEVGMEVIHDGTRFVMLTPSYAATSIDGLTWTWNALPINLSFTATAGRVAYDGSGTYVVVGSGGIITSTNLSDWTMPTLPSVLSSQFIEVIHGNGVFMALSGSHEVLTSADGSSWTNHGQLVGSSQFLAYANVSGTTPTFIAMDDFGGTYISENNGATWTAGAATGDGGTTFEITHDGTRFVVVSSALGGSIYYGTDGTGWTRVATSGYLWDVAYNGTSAYVGPGAGTLAGLVSTASITAPSFTTRVTAPLLSPSAVAFGNGVYLAGSVFGDIYSSSDATTWTSHPYTLDQVNGIAYGNVGGTTPTFVFATNDDSTTPVGGKIKSTTDYGATVTERVGVVFAQMTDVAYDAALAGFVAVGQQVIWHSADGVSGWTAGTAPAVNFNGISSNGTRYVAVGNGGEIYTSTDGSTWTARTSPTGMPLNAITHDGSRFVAVGFQGTVVTSTDGISWTAPTSGISDTLNAVVDHGGTLIAVADAGAMYASVDGGVTWSVRNSGSSHDLTDVVSDGSSQIMVVGDLGQVLTGAP